MADPKPQADGVGQISTILKGASARLRTLEKPTATQLANLLDKVNTALANIDTTVQTSIAANSYTKATIDNKLSGKSDTGHTHAASDIVSGGTTGAGFTVGGSLAVNGGVNPTGAVTAGGAVSGTTGTFNTGVNSSGAYSNNITTTRAAMWISSAGSMGIASSSERFKADIVKADIDPLAILDCEVDFYAYRTEVAKRDDPTSDGYVGPDYRVHTEVGMIAERLHEKGLWPFVIYEREPVMEDRIETRIDDEGELVEVPVQVQIGDRLKRVNGQPVPYGIHYELWGLAVHIATQHLAQQCAALDKRVSAIELALEKLT